MKKASIIKITNLNFTYPGTKEAVLKNITLEIERGDFVAIVGNNGCGKSTLCKTLNGLIPHFFIGDFSGEVEVCGRNTREHSVGELALKTGYVYQDFENQIVRPKVLDDASYACLNYAMEDYLEKGKEALRLTGLLSKAQDYVWQLSGGQKHLLALAGILALSPDILVLDEPVAQLDPNHARQIYDVLKYLNEVHGKTIIVIEHHTEFIADYCKHMVMMKQGEILWKRPVKEGLNRIEELVASQIYPPQVTLAVRYLRDKGIIGERGLLPTTLVEGIELLKGLEVKPQQLFREADLHPKSEAPKIIDFNNVSVEYRAIKGAPDKVLHQFSLEIRKGEKIALIGNNGAGKTTLLKLINGLLKPQQGEVSVYGNLTRHKTPEELSQWVSLVYQNPEEMFIKESIRCDIEYAMKARGMADYSQHTEALLEMFQLKDLEERDGRLLSGGQMRRASLAIGIALNPEILLMDEPTANLDLATRKEIIGILGHMKNVGETVIIATHDMQLVCEWADRIIVLNSGRVLADGTREEVFSNEGVVQTAGINPPEIYRLSKMLDASMECFTVQEFTDYFEKMI